MGVLRDKQAKTLSYKRQNTIKIKKEPPLNRFGGAHHA